MFQKVTIFQKGKNKSHRLMVQEGLHESQWEKDKSIKEKKKPTA